MRDVGLEVRVKGNLVINQVYLIYFTYSAEYLLFSSSILPSDAKLDFGDSVGDFPRMAYPCSINVLAPSCI